MRNFFDWGLCARIRAEVCSSPSTPSKIERNGVYVVDESVRKTLQVMVSTPTLSQVEERMQALRPELESFFQNQLTDDEPPYFAIYREGAFFRPHVDNGLSPETPELVQARKVTAVVYLNGESEEADQDSYSGGALTFYGIIDDPIWKSMGFPVTGETGLLIAFPADVIHEVTPITRGERYTIIKRFK